MKIRTGFVSNSSSSSFTVAASKMAEPAALGSLEKLEPLFKKHYFELLVGKWNESDKEFESVDGYGMLEKCWGDAWGITSFDDTDASIPVDKLNDGDYIIAIYDTYGDDDDFTVLDDDGDFDYYDYDIVLEQPDYVKDAVEILKKGEHFDMKEGSGRNG